MKFSFWILILFVSFWTPLHSKPGKTDLPAYDRKVFHSKKEYFWVLKGLKLIEKGMHARASEIFKQAVQSNPKSTAHYWLGLSHERSAEKMITDFHQMRGKSTQEKKTSRSSPSELDEALIKKTYKTALDSYRRAAELHPTMDQVHYRMGKALLDHFEKVTEAIKHLSIAVRLSPDEMTYRTALAQCYLTGKRFDDARYIAETALKSENLTIQSEAQMIMGRIEMEQKNLFKSIVKLKISLRLDSENFYPHYYLGKIYERTQKLENAIEAYWNFLKMVPKNLRDLRLIEESQKDFNRLRKGG